MDFNALNQFLNNQTLNILQDIVPGGKLTGAEYMAGEKTGGPGDSFRFNIKKNIGTDFATGETFGDLIALYASINGIPMIESAKQLAERYNFTPNLPSNMPDFVHYKHGKPSNYWPYHDNSGRIVCYIARYDTNSGKQFCPYSLINGQWTQKHLPEPRPLYNLQSLANHNNRPVLIVEGEKAADAARKLVGERYAVTTWINGAKSVSKTDFSPLQGKRVVIWPDADQPGREAAQNLTTILTPIAASVKILNTDGLPQGYDAADFTGSWDDLREFIVKRIASPEPQKQAELQTDDTDFPIITGSLKTAYDELGIALNKNGNPICNLDNITRVLEGCLHFRDNIWYDEFLNKIFYRSSGIVTTWSDILDINTAIKLQRYLAMTQVTDNMIYKAVSAYARKNTKNIVKDYLNNLQWDGTQRIDTFFIDICGSEDSEYTRSLSRNFLLSLVARALKPGSKVDCMPILEGVQGVKKSTMLSVLVGRELFANATSNVHHIDFFQCLQGKWLVEFAELHHFSKADITKLKDIMSTPVDTYRASYGRSAGDYPRQSVFAGTTNETNYLSDNTGARRFWPINVSRVEIQRLRDTRDQLFAEATSIYKSETPAYDDERVNSTWWVMPESSAYEQESRRIRDPWEDDILDFIKFKSTVTTQEIITDCLKIEPARKTRFDEIRTGGILRLLGFSRKKIRVGDELRWAYVRASGGAESVD